MRRFEYSAGGSDKFWEIELEDCSFTVNYGRIGAKGQLQTKTFDTNQKAQAEHDKLVQEKLKKGYVEVADPSAAPKTKRSKENLKAQLVAAGIDISTFQKVVLEGGLDEDEESNRPDASNSFYMIDLPPTEVLAAWQKARALVELTGYYPVISDEWDQLFSYMEFEDDFDSAPIIKEALTVNVDEFFKSIAGKAGDAREHMGTWTSDDSIDSGDKQFYVVTSSGGEGTLPLVFCPTKTSWQVCPVLCWGNSNDDIDPSCHAAVHKYWGTKYDAEIVCITGAIMEFKVNKPPTTQAAAMELAHQQFAYCSDIVHQGVDTISNLGKTLINSPKWYFWWD